MVFQGVVPGGASLGGVCRGGGAMLGRDGLVGHERHEVAQKPKVILRAGVELSDTSCGGSTIPHQG